MPEDRDNHILKQRIDHGEERSRVGCTDLLAAVQHEVKVLDKEIELLQLRISEHKWDLLASETLRSFGSCLWRHKKALEAAIAANDELCGASDASASAIGSHPNRKTK